MSPPRPDEASERPANGQRPQEGTRPHLQGAEGPPGHLRRPLYGQRRDLGWRRHPISTSGRTDCGFSCAWAAFRARSLQQAWNAHGEAAFAFEVLEEIRDDNAGDDPAPPQGARGPLARANSAPRRSSDRPSAGSAVVQSPELRREVAVVSGSRLPCLALGTVYATLFSQAWGSRALPPERLLTEAHDRFRSEPAARRRLCEKTVETRIARAVRRARARPGVGAAVAADRALPGARRPLRRPLLVRPVAHHRRAGALRHPRPVRSPPSSGSPGGRCALPGRRAPPPSPASSRRPAPCTGRPPPSPTASPRAPTTPPARRCGRPIAGACWPRSTACAPACRRRGWRAHDPYALRFLVAAALRRRLRHGRPGAHRPPRRGLPRRRDARPRRSPASTPG